MSATNEPASPRPAERTGEGVFEPARPQHTHGGHPGESDRVRGLAAGVRIGLIVLVLVVGFVITGALVSTKPKSKIRTEPLPPVLVRAVPAEPRSVDRVWEGFGTVRSMRRAQVRAEVSGRVVERPAAVEPGRRVDAGALLVALDETDYRSALTRAEQAAKALRAQLDGLAVDVERWSTQIDLIGEEIAAAERDLDRTRQAMDLGAGSPGEIDAKTTALRRAQREQDGLRQQLESVPARRLALEAELAGRVADQRVASENLSRARVASPIAGEIQEVGPRVGDWVGAGTAVATVVDLARVEIPLSLPQSAASWVHAGDAVSVWLGEAVGEPTHTGKVTRLSPEADASNRTITVFVEVEQEPEASDRLLPGAFVHGRVRTPDPVRRVVLPRRAIRSGRVMVIETDKQGVRRVRVHPVETGYAIDGRLPEVDPVETEWVVLAPGTEPPAGSPVAVTALEQLRPGARVRLSGDPVTAGGDNAEAGPAGGDVGATPGGEG